MVSYVNKMNVFIFITDTDVRHNHALLAYASDGFSWSGNLLPHVGNFDEMQVLTQKTTLDHSMWFHDFDFKCTEWILMEFSGDTICMLKINFNFEHTLCI